MNSVAEKIQSRGHWHRLIQPLPFVQDRVVFGDLEEILQRSVVEFRGWSFPKLNRDGRIDRGQDFIGQAFKWQDRLEVWRLFQSGQFISVQAFMLDWREEAKWFTVNLPGGPSDYLGILDAVGSFTEFFEFAARLALTAAGADRMRVSIEARNLGERELIMDTNTRPPLFHSYKTRASSWVYSRDLTLAEIEGKPQELAIEGVREFLQRFGLSGEGGALREIQASLAR